MKSFLFWIISVLSASLLQAEQNPVLYYFHGKIVEDQGLAAESAKYGKYEYTDVLQALRELGFDVRSEIREKNTDAKAFAHKKASEIQSLLSSGFNEKNLYLLGASKGGQIAIEIQQILKNPDIKTILLASLFPRTVQDQSYQLYGHVLFLYDDEDTLVARKPDLIVKRSPKLKSFQQKSFSLGLGHGLLFRPEPAWINAIRAWKQALVQ